MVCLRLPRRVSKSRRVVGKREPCGNSPGIVSAALEEGRRRRRGSPQAARADCGEFRMRQDRDITGARLPLFVKSAHAPSKRNQVFPGNCAAVSPREKSTVLDLASIAHFSQKKFESPALLGARAKSGGQRISCFDRRSKTTSRPLAKEKRFPHSYIVDNANRSAAISAGHRLPRRSSWAAPGRNARKLRSRQCRAQRKRAMNRTIFANSACSGMRAIWRARNPIRLLEAAKSVRA
jgi:hypothetical protein